MELHHVRMTANRALTGNYGHREAGESFTTDNRTAESLEARGLARRYQPPQPKKISLPWAWEHVEKKMQTPPENKMIAVDQNKCMTPAPPDAPDIFGEAARLLRERGIRGTPELSPIPEPTPIRRGRGRPPGAKNKPR